MREQFEDFYNEISLALRTNSDARSWRAALYHIWESIDPHSLPRPPRMSLPSPPASNSTWISFEWLSHQDPIAWINSDIWENCMQPDLHHQWPADRLHRCKTGERLDRILPILRSWSSLTQTIHRDNIDTHIQAVWGQIFLWTTLMTRNSPIFWEVYPVLHLGAKVYACLNRNGNLEPRGEAREVTLEGWEKVGSMCYAIFKPDPHSETLAFNFTWEEASLVLAFRHRTAQDHYLRILARSEPGRSPSASETALPIHRSPGMSIPK